MKDHVIISFLLILIPLHFSFVDEDPATHNIYFEHDSHVLTSSGQSILRDVYAELTDNRSVRFGVRGSMSSDLSRYERNALTDRRAKSITGHLYKMGISNNDMEVINMTDPYSKQAYSDAASEWKLVVEVFKQPDLGMSVFTSIQEAFPMPAQRFMIDPTQDNTINGMQGTVVFIPANTLQCSDGSKATGTVHVELKEVYSKADIILAGLHTMAAGRMLETGGTINLMAYCGNDEASISPGSAIDIDFPNQTGSPLKEGMKTFNSYQTEDGSFDWYEASESTSSSTTTERFYINGEEVDRETYMNLVEEWEMEKEAMAARDRSAKSAEALDSYLLSTEELGWINCDRFYEEPNVTDVIVQVDPSLNPALRMVFDNINSVMAPEFISKNEMQFSGVPVGERITIVGYSMMDDKAFFGKIPAIVSNGASYNLKMSTTQKQQLETELFALN